MNHHVLVQGFATLGPSEMSTGPSEPESWRAGAFNACDLQGTRYLNACDLQGAGHLTPVILKGPGI